MEIEKLSIIQLILRSKFLKKKLELVNNSPLISLFKLTEIKKPLGCHKETKLSSHLQKRGENGSELQTYTNNSNQVIHRKATFHHLFKFSLEKRGKYVTLLPHL